ncbi:MAG: disulfide bond formation protein B [Candidatus Doudnabacteria bacterium]|nr:disulfide bond formation protein B [Candidatus Doudnabacteria bacterium]
MNKKTILYICFTLALLATAGSLFMSEVLGWIPCVLCWYQRIMIYPLVIIFGIAIARGVSNLEFIVWPMTGIGGLIAFYHNLLQYHIIPEKLGPCVNGVSCLTVYNLGFKFLTVPLLSLLMFLAIAILMIAYTRAKDE